MHPYINNCGQKLNSMSRYCIWTWGLCTVNILLMPICFRLVAAKRSQLSCKLERFEWVFDRGAKDLHIELLWTWRTIGNNPGIYNNKLLLTLFPQLFALITNKQRQMQTERGFHWCWVLNILAPSHISEQVWPYPLPPVNTIWQLVQFPLWSRHGTIYIPSALCPEL